MQQPCGTYTRHGMPHLTPRHTCATATLHGLLEAAAAVSLTTAPAAVLSALCCILLAALHRASWRGGAATGSALNQRTAAGSAAAAATVEIVQASLVLLCTAPSGRRRCESKAALPLRGCKSPCCNGGFRARQVASSILRQKDDSVLVSARFLRACAVPGSSGGGSSRHSSQHSTTLGRSTD